MGLLFGSAGAHTYLKSGQVAPPPPSSIQGSLSNNKGFLFRLLLAAGRELIISDLSPYRLFPQYW